MVVRFACVQVRANKVRLHVMIMYMKLWEIMIWTKENGNNGGNGDYGKWKMNIDTNY